MTDNLIDFRYKQGKSVVEFAEILDISYDFYYKIERNKRNPSYNFLLKFKQQFPEADIDKIFFENILDKMSKNIF